MSLTLLIYLAGVADGVNVLFAVLAFLAGFASMSSTILYWVSLNDTYRDVSESLGSTAKWGAVIALICGVGAALTPSRNTVIAMAAAEFVTNSDNISELAEELGDIGTSSLMLLNDMLIDKVEELVE